VILNTGIPYTYTQNSKNTKEDIRKQIDAILGASGNRTTITKETVSILEEAYNISKKLGYKQEMTDAGIALMTYYMSYGTGQKVMELGDDIKKAAPVSAENEANLHRLLGQAYSTMKLLDKSHKEYHLAIQYAKKISTDNDVRHYTLAKTYQNIVNYFSQTFRHRDSMLYYNSLALEQAAQISESSDKVSADLKYSLIVVLWNTTAFYYLYVIEPPQPLIAGRCLLKALEITEERKGNISKPIEIDIYTSLSRFYFSQKLYDSCIIYGKKSLAVENEFPSPYKRADTYKRLAQAYEETANKEQSLKYAKLLIALNDSLALKEKIEGAATIKKMITEQEAIIQRRKQIIGIAVATLLAILIVPLLLWEKNKATLQKKYEQLIKQLKAEKEAASITPEEVENKTDFALQTKNSANPEMTDPTAYLSGQTRGTQTDEINFAWQEEISSTAGTEQNGSAGMTEENEGPKPENEASVVSISDGTLKALLTKLRKFEKSGRYLKKDINLTSLAHQLGTNPKYLSEAIKLHSNKTFSNYINGLKISHITHKLYEEPVYLEYKVSHLAEECGFASSQVFVRVFKKETGFPPSYFIEHLKDAKARG
jgi:AraC-like DNA-binding protein